MTLWGFSGIAGADDGFGDENVHGESDGRNIGAGAGRGNGPLPGIVIEGGGGSGGSFSTTSTNWSPPACYYAPEYTPEEFEQHYLDYLHSPLHSGKAEAVYWYRENYGEEGGVNFNLDAEEEGMWWGSFINTASDDHEGKLACSEPWFWVPFGEAPPPLPGVPTPELLAGLAYEHTRVPDTEIALNPEDADHQIVNLPTWIWTEGSSTAPVSVTARVVGYDIWATTTAEPDRLTIDPGTRDAVTHPASGECGIAGDGTIGEPYRAGRAEEPPPCGVTYLRATHSGGPHQLLATLTWDVSWVGSGGAGGDLPDGSVSTPQDIEVEEIQAVVR
ncbi:hypothetical protein [Streptomyces sp. ST2-7A]|uniref:hypothetical protein n=1 Tax=Streptomyces sp. ST2-7A TaxID=2907214 RepID=UPI001F48EF0D|nr:hypothetical protein [Streptomyces sp. ST2-7A]